MKNHSHRRNAVAMACAAVFCTLLFLCCSSSLSSDGPPAEPYHMWMFQTADIVGLGRAVGQQGDALIIDVQHAWLGSFSTNPVTINGAFGVWSDGISRDTSEYYEGKNIVFFATTNECKRAISASPSYGAWNFETPLIITNEAGACDPKFVYSNPPTWYALETNDLEHLAFFSNIVNSIVASRDRTLFYTTLRDAIKTDETGADPYKTMATMTMRELFWSDTETNLVAALNDPMLALRLRNHALFQLKQRFDWPATNTVPEP